MTRTEPNGCGVSTSFGARPLTVTGLRYPTGSPSGLAKPRRAGPAYAYRRLDFQNLQASPPETDMFQEMAVEDEAPSAVEEAAAFFSAAEATAAAYATLMLSPPPTPPVPAADREISATTSQTVVGFKELPESEDMDQAADEQQTEMPAVKDNIVVKLVKRVQSKGVSSEQIPGKTPRKTAGCKPNVMDGGVRKKVVGNAPGCPIKAEQGHTRLSYKIMLQMQRNAKESKTGKHKITLPWHDHVEYTKNKGDRINMWKQVSIMHWVLASLDLLDLTQPGCTLLTSGKGGSKSALPRLRLSPKVSESLASLDDMVQLVEERGGAGPRKTPLAHLLRVGRMDREEATAQAGSKADEQRLCGEWQAAYKELEEHMMKWAKANKGRLW